MNISDSNMDTRAISLLVKFLRIVIDIHHLNSSFTVILKVVKEGLSR